MTWNGDISQMNQLADRLADLKEVPSRVAARVAPLLAAELQTEFDSGTDPYGAPWAPLAPSTLAHGRTPPPLTDTGAMRGSARVAPLRGSGIGITIDHPAAVHQAGAPSKNIPARPILPAEDELPQNWQDIIEDATVAEYRRSR